MGSRAIDMTGRKVGRLTVTGPTPIPPGMLRPGGWWLCDCECGSVGVPINGQQLRQYGKGSRRGTGSCGCLMKDAAAHARRVMVESGETFARKCKTCGIDFLGNARRQYCGRKCRPSYIRSLKLAAG